MRFALVRFVSLALLVQGASCSLSPSDGDVNGGGGLTSSSMGGGSGGAIESGGASGSGAATSSGGSSLQTGGAASTGGTASGGAGALSGGSGGASSAGGARESGGASTSGGAQGAGGQEGSGGARSSGPFKFMALGDSITGTTCYTQYLAQAFADAGSPEVTFVGGVTNNQSCPGTGNTKSEGHGGYLVTYLRTNSPPQSGKGTLTELQTWTQAKPDIVLIHFGTNDVWNNIAASQILEAESFVIDEFRKQNPNILFFISKIIPMNPDGCAECAARVSALNAALTSEWVESHSNAASKVRIVDQWTGFNTSTDTGDGVHPNPSGGKKMATRAFETITGAIQ